MNEIPNEFWSLGLESMCVNNATGRQPYNLQESINAVLPVGWLFVHHTIKERDSFGPVTSVLALIGPDGLIYKSLI